MEQVQKAVQEDVVQGMPVEEVQEGPENVCKIPVLVRLFLYAIKMSDLVFITQDSLGLFWCSMDSLFKASSVDKGAGQFSLHDRL